MKKDKVNYRKYKRYWRLLFKPRLELDSSYWRKYICFKNLMTEVDIVNYLLEQNEELKATYNLYQSILYSLQRKDYKLFKDIINKDYQNISEYMLTSLNTLKEFSSHIKNTLELPYSNGVMERNNNTCKLIKRIAFGYKNFNNFKAKILIITNIFRNSKKVMNFTSSPLKVQEPKTRVCSLVSFLSSLLWPESPLFLVPVKAGIATFFSSCQSRNRFFFKFLLIVGITSFFHNKIITYVLIIYHNLIKLYIFCIFFSFSCNVIKKSAKL